MGSLLGASIMVALALVAAPSSVRAWANGGSAAADRTPIGKEIGTAQAGANVSADSGPAPQTSSVEVRNGVTVVSPALRVPFVDADQLRDASESAQPEASQRANTAERAVVKKRGTRAVHYARSSAPHFPRPRIVLTARRVIGALLP